MAEELAELLAEHEDKIKELYEAYADRFFDHAEFWMSLAGEEASHAALIRGAIAKMPVRQEASYTPPRFKPELVRSSIGYISKAIEALSFTPVTILNALAASIDIERSMIEHRFFEELKGSSILPDEVFSTLSGATQAHLERVMKKFAELKGNR